MNEKFEFENIFLHFADKYETGKNSLTDAAIAAIFDSIDICGFSTNCPQNNKLQSQ